MQDEGVLALAIDDAVNRVVGTNSPGLALLVASGDDIIHHRAYGMADVEAGIPLRSDHRFIIGSVTKQFTGAAAQMLAAEGLLDLDGTIAQFFPGFPSYAERVTVRQLLTHTSGIREYLNEEFWDLCSLGQQPTQEDVLELICRFSDLEFEPGQRWRYSNSAYVMLGSIIEQVSGTTFGGFLAQRVFAPLGMNDSVAGTLPVMLDRQAAGYTYRCRTDFERAPYHTGTVGWADGNIISTAGDLLLWARALDSVSLLTSSQLAEAYVPVRPLDPSFSRYGLGHVIGEWRGVRMIHHGGGTLGYVSRLSRFPDAGLTVVILSNAAGIDLAGVEGAVVELCLGGIMAPVARFDMDTDLLRSLAGTYGHERGGESRLTLSYDEDRGWLTATGEKLLPPGRTALVPVAADCLRFDDKRDFYLQVSREGLRLLMHGHVSGLYRADDE